jgi:FAD/FMN-containing dehydrogenase
MVATNAGGTHVLRYGHLRSQLLGVEAVLATGQVISRLGGLVKDNTGYDLAGLIEGSEGTLAVVTAARLRLVPLLPETATALIGLTGTRAALSVLASLRKRVAGLEAAEILYHDGLALVCETAGLAPPLRPRFPAYLLVESAGHGDVGEELARALADVDEAATAVATDAAGRARLWAYRERHSEAISSLGIPHKLDVTLPMARLASFESAVREHVATVAPGSTTLLFGHLGDGNLHVNVVGPAPDDDTVDDAVLHLAVDHGGSISAEHGIGRAKARWLGLARSDSEIQAMRAIKRALDPTGLLNPGVLFPPGAGQH